MDIKKMQEKLNKKMGGGVQMSSIQDGMASVELMFEGPRLRTLGYDALDNKKFREARTHFTEAVQLTERALGPNCWQLVPSLTGLCEAYIGLADWPNADMVAKRGLKLAIEGKDQENIPIIKNYMKQIAQNWKPKEPANENGNKKSCVDEKCGLCGANDPNYRCSACHRVRYCSKECQKENWTIHKPTCVIYRQEKSSI